MDCDIKRIKELIESKKDKYPNMSNIWLKYIDEKTKLLSKSLEKAEEIFVNIEDLSDKDLSYSTIVTLYLIKHHCLD